LDLRLSAKENAEINTAFTKATQRKRSDYAKNIL
jgi:hypothetical protein